MYLSQWIHIQQVAWGEKEGAKTPWKILAAVELVALLSLVSWFSLGTFFLQATHVWFFPNLSTAEPWPNPGDLAFYSLIPFLKGTPM